MLDKKYINILAKQVQNILLPQQRPCCDWDVHYVDYTAIHKMCPFIVVHYFSSLVYCIEYLAMGNNCQAMLASEGEKAEVVTVKKASKAKVKHSNVKH